MGKYNEDQIYWIRAVYLIFSVFWLLLIFVFKLYLMPCNIVLIIPFIVFFISFCCASYFTEELNKDVFETTFITIGLVISLPLVAWLSKDYKGDIEHITTVIILAMVLILASTIHIWIAPEYMCVWKHCRSSFETLAIVLYILALVSYFFTKNSIN